MTTRAHTAAWLSALALTIVTALAILFFSDKRIEERMAGTDTVFIGSSLTRYALPVHNQVAPLPQIGSDKALRFGLNVGTESDFLYFLTAAIDADVDVIFVEINQLFSQFADQPDHCRWSGQFLHSHKALKLAAKAIFRGDDIGAIDAIGNAEPRTIDDHILDVSYPMRNHRACYVEEWKTLVANAQDSQIVLIVLPRDAVANDLIGTKAKEESDRFAREFAADLGLPLFTPGVAGDWGQEYFIDQAHMSKLGSDRFLSELSVWWSDNS